MSIQWSVFAVWLTGAVVFTVWSVMNGGWAKAKGIAEDEVGVRGALALVLLAGAAWPAIPFIWAMDDRRDG